VGPLQEESGVVIDDGAHWMEIERGGRRARRIVDSAQHSTAGR
jgi:hypothetical protein